MQWLKILLIGAVFLTACKQQDSAPKPPASTPQTTAPTPQPAPTPPPTTATPAPTKKRRTGKRYPFGPGGLAAASALWMGEVTNPIQSVWYIAKKTQNDSL